jgi:O-antigen ligase
LAGSPATVRFFISDTKRSDLALSTIQHPALRRARPAARGAYGLSALTRTPWPLALLLISLVMPPETNVMAGPIRLSPFRVVLILTFFPCAAALFGGRAGRLNLVDWLMLMHVCWAALALFVNHGVQQIEAAGIYGIEVFGAYMIGRVYVRDAQSFRCCAAWLLLLVGLIGITTVVESLTGRHVIREFVGAALGKPFSSPIGERFGYTRAYGPFDHPILYGVFAMSVLSLSWFTLSRNDKLSFSRIGQTLVVFVSGATALSSGAFATMIVQAGLITYERLFRWLPHRWWLLSGGMVAAYVFIDALSNRSGIKVFLSYLTFSAHTAYSRLNIWHFGMAEVKRHPVFGIGANDWARPNWMGDSVDNFWLFTAMRYGVPGFLLLASALIVLFWKIGRNPIRNERGRIVLCSSTDEGRLRLGWLYTMIGITVAAATVHLWNSVAIYFFFLMGAGVWLIKPPAPTARRVVVRRAVRDGSPIADAMSGRTESA